MTPLNPQDKEIREEYPFRVNQTAEHIANLVRGCLTTLWEEAEKQTEQRVSSELAEKINKGVLERCRKEKKHEIAQERQRVLREVEKDILEIGVRNADSGYYDNAIRDVLAKLQEKINPE